jgi:hypothetical protein
MAYNITYYGRHEYILVLRIRYIGKLQAVATVTYSQKNETFLIFAIPIPLTFVRTG